MEENAQLSEEKQELLDKILLLEARVQELESSAKHNPVMEVCVAQHGDRYHVNRHCQHLRNRPKVRNLGPCQHCTV